MDETPSFPMAPAAFSGRSREVDPGAVFDWLTQGWTMFLVNPGIWLGCGVLLLVMLMAISIVPVFGQIAAHLLVPLFGAGMLQLCRRISDGQEPQISDLFAGFRHNAGQLVMVGVFFALGIFGIALVAGGFGLSVTTESATSLRLPGVVYRTLDCPALRDIELACLYRRGDPSPVLAAFVDVVRAFARQRARSRAETQV